MNKIVLGLTALLLASTTGCGLIQKDEYATCKVTDKDRVMTEQGSEARVYTDCGTFIVADSLTRGTFTSADTFGAIEEGKTYRLTYHGWRNGLLSMFPNITEAKEVK
jgi:hypothetical protein